MNKPQNQGWRSGAAPKGTRKKSRDWRQDQAARGPSRIRWGRVLKVGTSVSVITGLIGLIIYLLLLLSEKQKTSVIALGPAAYPQLAPQLDTPAAADLANLWATSASAEVQEFPAVSGSDFEVPETLEKTSIFALTAVARPGGSGIELLGGSTQPDDIRGATSLESVLAAVSKARGNKLLLIDLSRVRNDRRLGLMAVDFLSEIEKRAADVRRTVILVSSRAGERSWSSQRFGGGTAFAHFVREALHGHADTDNDKYITVSELVRHVQVNTANWVYRNRETSPGQHPVSFPPLEKLEGELNFSVARINAEPASLLSEVPSTDQAEASLARLWQDRESLGPAWRSSPAAWRTLTHELLSAEESLSLGRMTEFDTAVARIPALIDALRKADDGNDALKRESYFAGNVLARLNSGGDNTSSNEAVVLPEAVIRRNIDWFNTRQQAAGVAAIDAQRAADAVTLQTLAEKVLAESIGVIPFVAESLQAADTQRRAEHDGLFCRVDGDPPEKTATALYERAQSEIAIVRRAQEALFDALMMLPYLADYAAADLGDAGTRDRLLQFVRDEANRDMFFAAPSDEQTFLAMEPSALCARTHAIETSLGSDHVAAQIAALFAETRALRHQFAGRWNLKGMEIVGQRVRERTDALSRLFSDRAADLSRDPTKQPTPLDWQPVADLLRLPFLPATARAALYRTRLQHERNMSTGEAIGSPETDNAAAKKAMLARGEWNAFWALVELSLSADGSVGTGNAPLPVVQGKLQRSENITRWLALGDDASAYDRLVQVGRFVHEQHTALRNQVSEDVRRALAASDPVLRRRLLARGDYLTRMLHPFDARQLKVDPRAVMREMELVEFALYYGDRTARDFWRIPDAAVGEPDWYRSVLDACLRLSERQNGAAFAQHAELSAVAEPRLELASPTQVRFSRADQFQPLGLSVGRSNAPAGTAAVWLRNGAKPVSVRISQNGLPLSTKQGSTQSFRLERSAAGADCVDGVLAADLYFRGHLHSVDAPVNPCSAPSSVVSIVPAPPTGAVKVEGKAERSIVFVLDWSDSMSRGTDRWRTAIEKLTAVIGELEPEDEVALVLFGHRVIYRADGYDVNGNWELFGDKRPTADNRGLRSDFQTLAPLTRKREAMVLTGQPKPATLADWLKKLREDPLYGPYGSTPMFGAINAAYDLLKANGGAIVVITDGAATDDDDPQMIGQKLLRSNVSATVILFDFDDPKNQRLIANNGMATLRAANDPVKLAEAINRAIPARDYTAAWGANFRSDAALLGDPLTGLSPSVYSIESGLNTKLENVLIRGGEQHLLKITNGQFLRVRRHSVLAPVNAQGDIQPGDPTLLAHSRFEIDRGNAMIEVILDHEEDVRTVNWPAEVSFEMAPAGGEPVKNLSIEFVPGRTVPTWHLSTTDWPETDPDAVISAFWKMQATPADHTFAFSQIGSGDVLTLPNVPNRLPELVVEGVFRAPVLTVTIRAAGPVPEGTDPLSTLRVRAGQIVSGAFAADAYPVTERRWPDGRTAEFAFTLPGALPGNLRIGVTSAAALRNGAVRLQDGVVQRRPTRTR